MKVISVANHKGGSGKTTVAVNLANALTHEEHGAHRVLLIDLDPQGNAGTGLGLDVMKAPQTTYDLMTTREPHLAEYALPAGLRLQAIVSNLDCASLETELMNRLNRERILASAFEAAQGNGVLPFDIVIIDTPPSLGLLTLNAMVVSHEVLVVVDCGFYALYGLRRLQDTVELIGESFGRNIEIRALVNNFDGRQNLDRDVAEEVRRTFGERTYETIIRRNVRLKEAQSAGEPIIEYSPSSHGARDFHALADEVRRVKRLRPRRRQKRKGR